jgi:hypothetical protein
LDAKIWRLRPPGVGAGLKFAPKEGTLLAEFELTECVIGPITIKVFGSVLGSSVLGIPAGTTTNAVHATVTADKALRLQNATTARLPASKGR